MEEKLISMINNAYKIEHIANELHFHMLEDKEFAKDVYSSGALQSMISTIQESIVLVGQIRSKNTIKTF